MNIRSSCHPSINISNIIYFINIPGIVKAILIGISISNTIATNGISFDFISMSITSISINIISIVISSLTRAIFIIIVIITMIIFFIIVTVISGCGSVGGSGKLFLSDNNA